MTRKEYEEKVKYIMCNKNKYGIYHKQNFIDYKSYGEMAPINSDIIINMPSSKIILSEEVYNALQAVCYVTNDTNKEFPFFLYGKEENNNIVFKEFESSSNNRQSTEAKFNQEMIKSLCKKVYNNINNGLVVCHGHSHPPIGNFHQNFSLGDFISYIQMNKENDVFNNKEVELTSCLVTSTGDINFVFYDNINDNFYRFTKIYVKDKYNNLSPVNCYGLNQENQLNYRNRER